MARFSDYQVPADHPAVQSGHISAGDTVPFLTVVKNERGIGGYAFTPGGIHYVNQFKTDDEVAAEKAEAQAQRDAEAKEANLRAAQESNDNGDEDE